MSSNDMWYYVSWIYEDAIEKGCDYRAYAGKTLKADYDI